MVKVSNYNGERIKDVVSTIIFVKILKNFARLTVNYLVHRTSNLKQSAIKIHSLIVVCTTSFMRNLIVETK